ncbi:MULTISPECIES: DUF4097 family beta strand repeat-containing protein [Kitasatospora]|uniref:DUF4097 family beta strand repeat-containing protein n=1 Tax=Kitasatospora cathayae TaxID=3004092 RepID=A0ABY7QA22_9ACTN|nr:DUF4097 family beta strand repeat-containing protein [Kitasatospora sp. HUAS 3-15]WBP88971.1 DUF4097 family beta strand repeat-containing protein [Kitasatospora sp. HUAS 3-15]
MDGAKAWRITGTLAVVLGMLAAGLQTWSLVVRQHTSSTRPYEMAIHQVRLETGSASVRLRAGREGRVVVSQQLDWMFRKPVVSSTVVGDVLTVGMHCRQVLSFTDLGCGAEIELEVPAATAVTGSVSSGSVSVEGLSGSVRMQLTSGQLSLVHTSGEVWARTTSGQVQATDLSAPRVTAETTSGSVELYFTKAPHAVDAKATSGSVIVNVPGNSRYAFSSEIGSGSGQIDPQLADPTSPDTIHAEVTSGSLSINPS